MGGNEDFLVIAFAFAGVEILSALFACLGIIVALGLRQSFVGYARFYAYILFFLKSLVRAGYFMYSPFNMDEEWTNIEDKIITDTTFHWTVIGTFIITSQLITTVKNPYLKMSLAQFHKRLAIYIAFYVGFILFPLLLLRICLSNYGDDSHQSLADGIVYSVLGMLLVLNTVGFVHSVLCLCQVSRAASTEFGAVDSSTQEFSTWEKYRGLIFLTTMYTLITVYIISLLVVSTVENWHAKRRLHYQFMSHFYAIDIAIVFSLEMVQTCSNSSRKQWNVNAKRNSTSNSNSNSNIQNIDNASSSSSSSSLQEIQTRRTSSLSQNCESTTDSLSPTSASLTNLTLATSSVLELPSNKIILSTTKEEVV